MKPETRNWFELFKSFISLLRIDSKEVAATDERGSELNLWKSQEIFLKEVCKGLDQGVRTFYCLKARQLGVTTISLAIDLFWLSMHPGTIGALVTDTEANKEANRALLKRYVDSFPKGFFGRSFTILKDNRNFMLFSNGSRLDFLVAGTRTKKTWGEGKGYVLAHCTEVANYGSKEGLDSFREALAENHPNRLTIYESTAKGFNHYRDMWLEACRDTLTKRRIFIGWWSKELNRIKRTDRRFALYGKEDPDPEERELIENVKEAYGFTVTQEQLAWYRWRVSDQSSDMQTQFQNIPWNESQSFVMTGFSFFAVRQLQNDLERITNKENPIPYHGYKYILGNDFHAGVMEPITSRDQIGEVELRVWEDPQPDGQYVIGCDPAWGRNEWKDRHAVSVWRCFADCLVQVAEYADNNTENRQAAWVLAHLAGSYWNCMVNIELTGGPGRAVLTELGHLRERMRSDMYRERAREDYDWDDFMHNARWYLYHKCDSASAGYPKCWETTGSNKWEIMLQLKDAHNTNQLIVRSAPLVEEMLTVVQEGSEIGAPGKAKDDRVFAAALANRAWIDWVRNGMIQNGDTYEAIMRRETEGESRGAASVVDKIVHNFMARAADYEEPPTAREQWLADRGFV